MILFVSNYYNHHQAPFSRAMYRLTSGEYRFVATEPMEQERIDMGWSGMNDEFVLNYSDDPALCLKLIDTAETVIYGSAPEEMFKCRLASGKLTLKYTERLYKKKPNRFKMLFAPFRHYMRWTRFHTLFLLCAGAYTSADFARSGAFLGKAYKWGYFPEARRYDISHLIETKEPRSILWAARMIDWKHPELTIEVARRLKDSGYSFSMRLIGGGELEAYIRQMVQDYDLSDCVTLLGSMSPEDVRAEMERSRIFMFTSDRNEGWGAVLNEAMNSGCAVVADHAIGSVPYMVESEVNGLIYRDGDLDSLYSCVCRLLDDTDLADRLGSAAYTIVSESWNADAACERLLQLIRELRSGGQCDLFAAGPCSRAERLIDDWFLY